MRLSFCLVVLPIAVPQPRQHSKVLDHGHSGDPADDHGEIVPPVQNPTVPPTSAHGQHSPNRGVPAHEKRSLGGILRIPHRFLQFCGGESIYGKPHERKVLLQSEAPQ